ncbi:MAG: ABC-2 transporter permease [Psychrosphaera sp.]|nr:ABC-2 transporter permease [Psychrosphaera sp.]
MSKIVAIAKKELKTYFKSPIAYIMLIVPIALFNLIFYMIIEQNREVSLREVFRVMEFMFIFLIPILTMGLLAEEKSTGTMEFLMTAPLSNTTIVLGKYLGILTFFSILISLTLVYYGIAEYFGSPDRLTTLSGYVGIWLEGAFFIAVGLMTSSWTRNQIVAAIAAYVILFGLFFSTALTQYFSGPSKMLIEQLGTQGHLEHFAVGIITVADVTYYLSGILLCLILTRLSIENRLWQ